MKLLFLALCLISFNSFSSLTIDNFQGISLKTGSSELFEVSKLDRPLVLIFISKDCPCSKGNLSYINDLSKSYPEFNFMGVHAKKNTNLNDVKNYLSDKKLNFKVISDPSLEITSKFNALKTPHAFILNLKGEVVYNGGVTNSTFPENAKEYYLKNALEDLKGQRAIAKNVTKTLGCFIER